MESLLGALKYRDNVYSYLNTSLSFQVFLLQKYNKYNTNNWLIKNYLYFRNYNIITVVILNYIHTFFEIPPFKR